MKENCACGFIIAEPRGWLLGHPTNCGNRWDLPKGWAEKDEDHLEAAKRELLEETGLILTEQELARAIDLGQHPYQDHRDLHLFYVPVSKVDTTTLICESMVKIRRDQTFLRWTRSRCFPSTSCSPRSG